eukprot:Opistho-1_new@6660
MRTGRGAAGPVGAARGAGALRRTDAGRDRRQRVRRTELRHRRRAVLGPGPPRLRGPTAAGLTFPSTHNRSHPMGHMIELKAADGTRFPAYVAGPAGHPKAKGGLVVLQEIFGVNSHIRSVADGYAADGYFVVAPATFHRVKADVELGYTEADMGAGFGLKTAVEALPAPGVMPDIQAAIDHAAQAGKVGIVGYCWGGLLTWRSACMLKGLSAAVPYYGGGM